MLNKKAIRKYVTENPAPAIPQGHGLLLAEQVGYILRSSIKIIGHRRTLVLYIYDRSQAAAGNPAPIWTMFHSGNEYLTLARQDDGSTRWREAAFENLDKHYYISNKCAFFSAKDEQRVRSFLRDYNDKYDGIAALVRAQRSILEKRCRKRQLGREKKILKRMQPLKALPRDLKPWIRREIMPAYFRCEHTSARKPVTGICTSCGKESTLPPATHNSKLPCPHCKRELTVISAAKMGRRSDRDTVQVVEKTSDSEVVIRIVKVYYNYSRDSLVPKENIFENARIFVRRDLDGKVKTEPYYFYYGKGTLTHWLHGARPVYYYCDYFEAATYGHVYCRNLPDVLKGTPWEYSPITQFYGHFRGHIQMWPFLAAHVEHPKLEHLVKVEFYNLASDLAYDRVKAGLLDETQNRTHRILQVAAEDVDFLREMNVNAETLRIFQLYAGVKGRQQLLRWQLENDVSRDVAQCLAYTTAHKLMRYLDLQYSLLQARKTVYGMPRYQNMQAVVSEYRDYLEMCVKLGYDMANSFVLRPKDLQEAHDRVQRRVKIQNSIQLRKDFDAAMESISRHLDFEQDGMTIRVPSSPEAITAEGVALRHCVSSYVDRVARRECIILFLRLSDDLDKPYYTIEVRNRKAVQVRGIMNCAPTPEVQAFVDSFEKQVLMAAAA